MKPPISYYGGKQRMANKIIPLIPKHTVYAEPFAGGAAVMFMKPSPSVTNNDHYRECINDIDGRIVNFYTQLRDNGDELVRLLQLTPYSEEEHRIAKDLNCDDKLEAARRYYINSRQSFSKTICGGWSRSVYGCNSGMTWINKIATLPEYLERMAGVNIANTDALNFIKQWDSPQTFFYCDPPYPKADQGHYGGYTVDDFQKLVNVLDDCQGSFILSNYDQPDVVIPDDWERIEFNAYSSAAHRKHVTTKASKRTEVLWKRDNKVPIRKEIQKLYDSGKYDCFTG